MKLVDEQTLYKLWAKRLQDDWYSADYGAALSLAAKLLNDANDNGFVVVKGEDLERMCN